MTFKRSFIPKYTVFGNYNLITTGNYKLNPKTRGYKIEVICTCGKILYVDKNNLLKNKYGCKKCTVKTLFVKHGMAIKIKGSEIPEYKAWSHIKSRCYSKNNKKYKNYGGRGIKVCDRWIHSFENFYKDMGPRPSNKHSIDRINNDGDYSPENCRWADIITQSNNRRDNTVINYKNKNYTLNQLAKVVNINKQTLSVRLNRGWKIDEIVKPLVRNKFNIDFMINGERKSLKEWCKIYNIKYYIVYNRVKYYGTDILKALTTPVIKKTKKRSF